MCPHTGHPAGAKRTKTTDEPERTNLVPDHLSEAFFREIGLRWGYQAKIY